jgi:hypothetical protein
VQAVLVIAKFVPAKIVLVVLPANVVIGKTITLHCQTTAAFQERLLLKISERPYLIN